jgi:hypothetical protein
VHSLVPTRLVKPSRQKGLLLDTNRESLSLATRGSTLETKPGKNTGSGESGGMKATNQFGNPWVMARSGSLGAHAGSFWSHVPLTSVHSDWPELLLLQACSGH